MFAELRYALRALLRSPGFMLSAVLALALGIGANTAVFSVVYAVLLKPLPYPEPDRLVRLYETNPAEGIDAGGVSAGTFVDWRARSHAIDAFAMYNVVLGGETLWSIGDRAEVVRAASVSPALFTVLRVQPILGHAFPVEPRPQASVGQFLISYGLWQRAFGGAADVVGRRVLIEGRLPREIAGVMPRGFAFPEGVDAWTAAPLTNVPPAQRRNRQGSVIARLATGASIDDARRELRGISAQLAAEQPASNRGWSADVEPLAGADAKQSRFALLALMTAVAGVLLIGCANVANLLLARAVRRRREIAVRMALGAGVLRLARTVLAEALILAGGGIAVGLLLGRWVSALLVRLAPPDIPRLADVRTTAVVFLFAAAAGLSAAVLTALAPTLQTIRLERRGGWRPEMRGATNQSARLRRWLIAGEVAIVVLLLTGALLLVRTFVNLRGVDLGFETAHVAELETRWPIGTLFGAPGQQWPRVQRAVDGLVSAVASVPGVEAIGVVSEAPLTDGASEFAVWRADASGAHDLAPPADPRARWKADAFVVTPGYFTALGIPILRGRNFTAADRFPDDELTHPAPGRIGVVIINAAFATRYFPNEDPIGRSLVIPDASAFASVRTIVGVVADVRARTVAGAPLPTGYIPLAQNPDVFRPSLLVRSSLPFSAVAASVSARIASYDPKLVLLRVRPMDDLVSGALSRPRFNLLLLGTFALVALVLAAIGIYGVIAFLVAQRTREIGIRVALGARASDVIHLLMREGMTPVVAGALVGVAGSLAVARALRSLLFGVTPLDPVSLAGAPILLAAVAVLACYLPARRALRVDPLIALRDE